MSHFPNISPTGPSTSYMGHCHCGAIKYTITLPSPLTTPSAPSSHETTPYVVRSCNCSICARNGYLFVYPERKNFTFTPPACEELVKDYYFGNKKKPHRFCGQCGSSLLIDFKGVHKEELGDVVAVNVRMLVGVELDELTYDKFDGRGMLGPVYEDQKTEEIEEKKE